MPVAVRAAGVDTWSPCWWLEPGSIAARHLAALATEPARRGRLLPEVVAGHRIGWHAGAGLLYAEGHPCADGLGRPADLPSALERLEGELIAAGVPLPIGRRGVDAYGERFEGFAGVRRLDSTCDLAVSSSAEGLAILAGVAAVARDMPRAKSNVWWGGDGRVQTIALHGYAGGRLVGRFYDKGVEAGTAQPGRLLRPEDQRRWSKGYRRGVEELTGHYVREKFVSRFAPLWRAAKGVTVAGPMILGNKLADAVEAGDISPAQARSLAGYLVLEASGRRTATPARTRRHLQALARERGLVLADGVLQEVEVDLGAVLEAALESDAWERRG